MTCQICGRGSCCSAFHSAEEQQRFEKVIEAFDKAEEMRLQVHADLDAEAKAQEEVDEWIAKASA
jgi:hypothetical protein